MSQPDQLRNSPLVPEHGNRDTQSRTFWPTAEDPNSFCQYETVETKLIEPDYKFRIERNAGGGIIGVSAYRPEIQNLTEIDGAFQKTLLVGNHISKRSIIDREGRYHSVEWLKYTVDDIYFTETNRLMVDLVFEPTRMRGDCPPDPGKTVVSISAARLLESLGDQAPQSTWHQHTKHYDRTVIEKAYLPPDSPYEPLSSCSHLTFKQINGEGAKETVNSFLEGGPDGTIKHRLGGIPNGWKQPFGAYHDGRLIAALVLENHQNQAYFQKHNEILLTRLACHPTRPKNTGTWMIARARNWAQENGYRQIGAIAGVGDNRGTIYKAAGFDLDPANTGWASSDGWQSRPGRSSIRDDKQWYKRKWTYSLN